MDISKNTYDVKAVLQSGKELRLTNAVLQLDWQEAADEIAQRATIRLMQVQTDDGWLHSLLPLCTIIQIIGNGEVVFQGVLWEWEYSSDQQDRSVTVTCYDPMIYAKNSHFYAYYPAGKSTKDLIQDICSKNGIALNYQYESISHAKMKLNALSVADHIKKIVDEAKRKLSVAPVLLFEKGTLLIRKKGQNETVYLFQAGVNAISTSEKMTLNGLITEVSVLGKENKEGRRGLEATLTGKTEYGSLRRYVYRDGNDMLSAVRQEAQQMLDDHGKPERLITAKVPDIPTTRKGDLVRLKAGSLDGGYYVKGVTHNAGSRVMTLELEPANAE